jgi:hypothetical protein
MRDSSMQSHNQQNDSAPNRFTPDSSITNIGDDDHVWNNSADIMLGISQKSIDWTNAGKSLQIAADKLQGSDDCDMAIPAADQ